ncbi:MAG TPA: family 43 glycosylhydrolase [Candidatus Cryptobacteroides pullicola]|nr:family 43 glycosylhydrolase [Candidatus Cryptobacteroides pullicola]
MNTRNLIALSALALGLAPALDAQNPIIRDQFTADPTARVFEGKVYLYPSHDIISPVEPERKWFSMADYHVFSSEDLVNWTDHGMILSQENVPWGNPEGYSMWAPDCVYKNGKYYFYFPNAPKEGRGFAIGVAVADKPYGPFTPEQKPIEGVGGIDPCVLVTSDGSAYLYWSGMGLRGAKLADNMLELDGESVRLDENLPAGFKEGPFIFERNGKFYLTYPWVQDRTETLAYAMSDNPLGPYEFKGIIMAQSPSACWTNHHSLVEYKGEWYLFYHHNDYSPQFDKNRSVRIDKVIFNEDGTIQPVTPTLRGVGVSPARSIIQLDRYSFLSQGGTYIDFLNVENPFEGWFVNLPRPETWVEYEDIDFGSASPKTVKMRVRSEKGARVAFSAAENQYFAHMDIPASAAWTEVSAPMESELTGLNYVRAVVESGDVQIDWMTFE